MDWKDGVKGGPFTKDQVNQFVEFLSGLNPGQVQWLSGYFTGAGLNLQIGSNPIESSNVLHTESSARTTSESLLILYGTQTGNAEKLAYELEKKAKKAGIEVTVSSMAAFKIRDFKKVTNLAVIVSTQGLGDVPVQAEALHEALHGKKAPDLSGIKYSVLALGDTSYVQFCQVGKAFDAILGKLGAERVLDRVDCDVDYEDDASVWMESILAQFSKKAKSIQKVVLNEPHKEAETVSNLYTRKNPLEATLLEKIKLNGRGSSKETIHFEFSLENSGCTYIPGDTLGVYAPNSRSLVEAVLNATKLSGTEIVQTHSGKKELLDALTYDYELTPLTVFSLSRYADLSGSTYLKKILTDNFSIMEYLHGRDIIDLLKEFPIKISAGTLITILRKNTARMYSIASSQKAYEDEVHILVSTVRYSTYGRMREGLCSAYLADRLKPEGKAKVFIEENSKFRLPAEEQTPIIMVGPGTGVAPFRAFMQHREMSNTPGKSWLFFGDRNFTTDFLYQTEWQQYLKEGILTKADVAFSRDFDKKIYVQHKMQEKGKELYDWLENGAHFYVCGDASKMAKDVEQTLKEIVRIHGNKTKEQADEYIKYLQIADRYQADVY